MTREDSAGVAPDAGSRAMKRYLLGLLLGGFLALLLFVALLASLAMRGALPPPQIANSLCLDEKLAWMQEHPPGAPNLLVVGSSVAWRHFNSAEAVRANPALRPYNAGLCGISIGQTEKVVASLLKRLNTVHQMVLIASPVDFSDCSSANPANFDMEAADRFVFQRSPAYHFYLRYFDPGTLLMNSFNLRAERSDSTSFDSLVINSFGDGPLDPPRPRKLLYGEAQFDPRCFSALQRIAKLTQRQGVSLFVSLTPLNPRWVDQFDKNGLVQQQLRQQAKAALAGTGATLVLPPKLPERAFFDAIHLRWRYTGIFTRMLVAHAQPS